jgi:uncharacterized protein YccT (UPF0319 family)
MNTSLQELLFKIINIIDYRDNKENFVNEFVIATKQHALSDLINALPGDKQTEINQTLSANVNNQEKIIETIKTTFTEEQRKLAFEKAAKDAITGLIQSVNGTLSSVQKQKLAELPLDFTSAS